MDKLFDGYDGGPLLVALAKGGLPLNNGPSVKYCCSLARRL